MKKTFTLLMFVLMSAFAMATEYNGKLTVTINGIASSQRDAITVEQAADGKYELSLKNFTLNMGGNEMRVGNIVLAGLEGVKKGDVTTIKTSQVIKIQAGEGEGWIGPGLPEVPINLVAELCDDKLFATIDIEFAALSQTINVVFGTRGFQVENSDFELFHTTSITNPSDKNEVRTSEEPNAWHSFMSATNKGMWASFAWMATGVAHTFTSDVVRPGSEGSKSLLLTSAKVFGNIVANGTVTTGRINAGSLDAANTANNAYTDFTVTDLDANGDNFYSIMHGRPDSLAVWVKFTQSEPDAKNPYATVRAVITDGTYYQDPEDKEYDNVVAVAAYPTIETNNGEWQRISVPFNYTDAAANMQQKAIQITLSTNATPGKGSLDSLYVDDLALIYNCGANDIKIKGVSVPGFNADTQDYDIKSDEIALTEADIEVVPAGVATIVEKSVVSNDVRTSITVTTTSHDLMQTKTYTINIDKRDGINLAETDAATIAAIYTPDGVKVSAMQPGQIYIVKYTDGKVVKVAK